MTIMQVPVHFSPRWYQKDALTALDNGVKFAVWCWARRGGKDMTAFAYAVKKMVEQPMNVVLVFPTKEQGKNSFWENIENDGFKTIEHIPAALIARQDNSNMRIVLKNGSTFQIMGATEADALRGANAKVYILSEFVDLPAAVLDVIRPVVRNNGGQIIVQSTPKIDGISGGTFKILFDRAIEQMKVGNKQYASLITAKEYLTDEDLEDERQECIAKNGNDFWFNQEFLCDWGQSSSTSYYGAVMQLLKEKGNICDSPYNPAHPVFTAWDLGTSDSTAITFFQYYDKKLYVIDYYETHDIGYQPIVNFLKTKPYNYGWHFVPHDAAVRDQSDAIQRVYKLQDCGLINISIVTRENKEDGINGAVTGLINTVFNRGTTLILRNKLILYKRKFNGITGDYEGPEHKTESHAADSIRYLFAAIRQFFNEETGEFLYSPANAQSTYETDEVSMPAAYNPN